MNHTSTPSEIQRALENVVSPSGHACGCMGPQGDEPVCPCAMAFVIRYKGVWIRLEKVEREVSSFANTVVLTEIGDDKLHVISLVRKATGLGLFDTKKLVERAPVAILTDVWADVASELKSNLEAVGASVEIR